MFIKKSVLISAVTLSYILGTLSGATAGTEVYLNISKKFSQKIRIAVPYFTPVFSTSKEMKNTAAKSAEQLSNDLMLSGYFAPIIERAFVEENQADDAKRGKINFHEWKRIGADLVVKANYAEKGGRTLVRAAIYSINDGVKIFDKSYDESVAARRTLIHKLADDIVKTLTGEKGIAQTKVTFVHKNGRAKEICIMDYDGFGMKKLTHDGSISLYPKWSHDKKKLVYTSYINGRPQICLIDLRNNTRSIVSSSPGLNATAVFSPDDTKLALTLSRDGNPEIYIKELSTGSLYRITRDRSIDSSPAWSPDGKQLAFVSNRSGTPQIYIMNANGENLRRLTYSGNYNSAPAWSTKGDLIAHASQMGREFQICITNAETGQTDVITNEARDNEDPSWAPDGRHIIYTSTKNYKSSLFIVDIIDKNPVKLPDINSSTDMQNPSWSE